jgi:hypothetical protein
LSAFYTKVLGKPGWEGGGYVKDRHVRITTTDGELLRDFELEPTRDYQAQPKW